MINKNLSPFHNYPPPVFTLISRDYRCARGELTKGEYAMVEQALVSFRYNTKCE